MSNHLYFAYGSNLHEADRHRRGHGNTLGRLVAVAWLPDYELIFNYRSVSRGGGAANLRKRIGSAVPGALYEVADWNALDRKEGVPHCYERVSVDCLTLEGDPLPATTYIVVPQKQQGFVEPTPEYQRLVAEGLQAHGLNTEGLVGAARGQSGDYEIDGLFAYGTLMRDEERHGCIGPVNCALLAEVDGGLMDLGSFPGMVNDREGIVQGEFFRLVDVPCLLSRLDAIEGTLYRRVLRNVHVGDGRLRHAWVYVLARPWEQKKIVSGSWREHRGRQAAFLSRLALTHCTHTSEMQAIEALTTFLPFAFSPDTARRILFPLEQALASGVISERRLAQVTGVWTALTQAAV